MKVTGEEKTQEVSSIARSRLKIGLAFFTLTFIGANDGAVGVLLPSFMKHYAITSATVGLIFLASTCGYLIVSFNLGLLMQKIGNWPTLLTGATLVLLSTGMLSLQPPFALLLVCFFLLGTAVAILDPGLNIYIASLPQNTALLNYLHAFYGIGAWLGPLIASTVLALQLGWNSVYMFWCAAGLFLLISLGIVFRDWHDTHSAEGEQGRENIMAATLKLRYVWIAALFLLFYVGGEVTLGNWSYSLLTRERNGIPLISGWIVSGYWLGLTLGRLLLGKVAQKIGDKRMLRFCLFGVIIGLLIIWVTPLTPISALGLFLTGFCLGPIFPTAIAVMSRIVSARLLASTIGFMVSLGSMGAALFPWIMGNLAQGVGLWFLLPFCIAIALVQLGLWQSLHTRRIARTPVEGEGLQ